MSGKKKGLIFFILLLIIFAAVYLNQRMSVPEDFLTEEEILAALPLIGPEKEIQDILQIDEKTYFVPFVTDENGYGTSIFKSINGEWACVSESEASGPMLLQSETEPYIFWNVHPEDEVAEWKMYLISPRNYSVSYSDGGNEQSFYTPHIQVNESIETGEQSYGYAPLSSKMQEISKVIQSSEVEPEYMSLSMRLPLQYQALDSQGQETNLEETRKNGGGGSYIGGTVSIIPDLFIEELE